MSLSLEGREKCCSTVQGNKTPVTVPASWAPRPRRKHGEHEIPAEPYQSTSAPPTPLHCDIRTFWSQQAWRQSGAPRLASQPWKGREVASGGGHGKRRARAEERITSITVHTCSHLKRPLSPSPPLLGPPASRDGDKGFGGVVNTARCRVSNTPGLRDEDLRTLLAV